MVASLMKVVAMVRPTFQGKQNKAERTIIPPATSRSKVVAMARPNYWRSEQRFRCMRTQRACNGGSGY